MENLTQISTGHPRAAILDVGPFHCAPCDHVGTSFPIRFIRMRLISVVECLSINILSMFRKVIPDA